MIKIITELQALAQSGLAYAKDPFDIERYENILAIAAKFFSNHSTHSYQDILELFTKERGYATPKIDVRGAIFEHEKILLVKEKSDQLWKIIANV